MADREDRKAQLTAELEVARKSMRYALSDVSDGADVGKRVKRGLSDHTLLWLGGAVLLGTLIALLPRRQKKGAASPFKKGMDPSTQKKAAAAVAIGPILKLLFDVARPTLMRLASERLRPMAEQYFRRRHDGA